jgi:hypothetical protein
MRQDGCSIFEGYDRYVTMIVMESLAFFSGFEKKGPSRKKACAEYEANPLCGVCWRFTVVNVEKNSAGGSRDFFGSRRPFGVSTSFLLATLAEDMPDSVVEDRSRRSG